MKNIEVFDILFYILIFFDDSFVTDLLLMKKLLFQWHQCTTGKGMLPFKNPLSYILWLRHESSSRPIYISKDLSSPIFYSFSTGSVTPDQKNF